MNAEARANLGVVIAGHSLVKGYMIIILKYISTQQLQSVYLVMMVSGLLSSESGVGLTGALGFQPYSYNNYKAETRVHVSAPHLTEGPVSPTSSPPPSTQTVVVRLL